LLPRQKEAFSVWDLVAVLVGNDDFKSYLVLLIGAQKHSETSSQEECGTHAPVSVHSRRSWSAFLALFFLGLSFTFTFLCRSYWL